MLAGIIIVSYHNSEGTTQYITEQLPKLTTQYRIVVVGVAAQEQYGRALATACGLQYLGEGDIIDNEAKGWLVASIDNLGYARGNNLGVETLKQTGLHFDYYLFSNDDIEILSPNIIEQLAEGLKGNNNVAGVGPRIIGLDGKDQNPHTKYVSPMRQIAWKLFPILRSSTRYSVYNDSKGKSFSELAKNRKDNTDIDSIHDKIKNEPLLANDCYWVSGAFMMVKAACFDMVNGFDPRTFLYFEEAILAERFKKHGWHFRFEPSVYVLHYEGGSTDVHSKQRDAIEMASRLIYYKEYIHVNAIMLTLYKMICK